MQFNDRDSVIQAIKEYNLSHGFDYKVLESEPTTFYAKCKYFGENCQWLVRASLRKNLYCWEIRKYNGPHSCIGMRISQDHTKLDANTIAKFIYHMIQADPSLKVRTIIATIKDKYGYTVKYRRAYNAKQKAIVKIYGGWEEAYADLPRWSIAMYNAVPGSSVTLDSVDGFNLDGSIVPNAKVMRRYFWALGPCIKAFKHCKPIIQVDGTHLYGKYQQVLLVAVTQDGNDNIVPLAFCLVEGETADAWHFFLSRLRTHVVTIDGIGLISDRHKSIDAAIRRSNGEWEPPRAFHRYCIRHFATNFQRKFKTPYLQNLVKRMGYSKTVHEFNTHYEQLRERGETYTNWLDRCPREKWALAFDGGYRWGHMTTNLVECINSVLKGVRNLPITSLVRATYIRLSELFVRKSTEANARKNARHHFSEALMNKIASLESQTRELFVTQMDRERESFLVKRLTTNEEFRVDLRNSYCDCVAFQTLRHPCCHVMACCNAMNISWGTYVHVVYRTNEICKVYSKSFGVVGNERTWPPHNGPRLHPDLALRRPKKGRPKSTRFLNEMDSQETRAPRRCTLCRNQGHRRSHCPYDAGPSS